MAEHDILEFVPGMSGTDLLIVADHASNHVPADIDLGVARAQLDTHSAVDLGVAPLARRLAAMTGAAAVLARVSRLVLDLNRDPEAPGMIPDAADGKPVPGNARLDAATRRARFDRFHVPYHAGLARHVALMQPKLILSLHSFTPLLASRPEDLRPWPIGILYNEDDRAARIALGLLRAAELNAGDNEPYSGRLLNYTMNRHAEGNGIAYLGVEVRQDGLMDAAGIARWAETLAPVILAARPGA